MNLIDEKIIMKLPLIKARTRARCMTDVIDQRIDGGEITARLDMFVSTEIASEMYSKVNDDIETNMVRRTSLAMDKILKDWWRQ